MGKVQFTKNHSVYKISPAGIGFLVGIASGKCVGGFDGSGLVEAAAGFQAYII